MFLPSDSDVNEMDERAGVINGVAKALDKRMDKLRKEITAVSDDVVLEMTSGHDRLIRLALAHVGKLP